MNGNGKPKAIMQHFAKKLFTKPESARNHDNIEGYIFGKSAKKALNDNNNSVDELRMFSQLAKFPLKPQQ
jgi:hypothetical protein